MIKQSGSGQPKPFAYFTGGIDLSEFKKRKYVIRYIIQYNTIRFITNGTELIFSSMYPHTALAVFFCTKNLIIGQSTLDCNLLYSLDIIQTELKRSQIFVS